MSKNKTVRNVFFTVFCLFACISLSYGESCSTAGATQNKYTASGCSYTTQSRTCCATTGEWSDWGGSCPSCSSSQCWDGSKCADKEAVSRSCLGNVTNAQSGTQTRTATCTNGSGWSYGSWSGTCTCKSGYTWSGSFCNRDNPPAARALDCQAVPMDKHPGWTWAGVELSTAPSAAMYVVLAITGDFFGWTEKSYGNITIDIPAGFVGKKSMEFDLNLPDGCPNCSYNNCVASVQSVGWR